MSVGVGGDRLSLKVDMEVEVVMRADLELVGEVVVVVLVVEEAWEMEDLDVVLVVLGVHLEVVVVVASVVLGVGLRLVGEVVVVVSVVEVVVAALAVEEAWVVEAVELEDADVVLVMEVLDLAVEERKVVEHLEAVQVVWDVAANVSSREVMVRAVVVLHQGHWVIGEGKGEEVGVAAGWVALY